MHMHPVYFYLTLKSGQSQGDEDIIDAFQRRLLRTYVLNVKWSKKVRSEDIYILTCVSK